MNPNQSNTRPADLADFAKAITPDKVGYICMLNPRRIGVLAFITFLEYRHFPPKPFNDDFQMALVRWEMMEYAVVVIPRAKEDLARVILKELGLRIADGIPRCISSTGTCSFPIDLPNVFTIENVPGHFAYKNDPALEKTAFDCENDAIAAEYRRLGCDENGRFPQENRPEPN